jgi:hypothetical protein
VLRQHTSVDRIGLDLRMRDDAHLLGVSDDDPLHVRTDHPCGRARVAFAEAVAWEDRAEMRRPHLAPVASITTTSAFS